MFNHHRMPRSLPHFERAVERFRTAPNPVFVHMSILKSPDPDTLARLRLRMRGPLLAYMLLTPGDADPGRTDLTVVRFRRKLKADGLPGGADEIGFTARLADDLRAAAGL